MVPKGHAEAALQGDTKEVRGDVRVQVGQVWESARRLPGGAAGFEMQTTVPGENTAVKGAATLPDRDFKAADR